MIYVQRMLKYIYIVILQNIKNLLSCRFKFLHLSIIINCIVFNYLLLNLHTYLRYLYANSQFYFKNSLLIVIYGLVEISRSTEQH